MEHLHCRSNEVVQDFTVAPNAGNESLIFQKNGMPMRACDAFHAAHSAILRAGGYMSALCCARPAVYDSKMA